MATTSRTYMSGNFVLNLDAVSCGFIKSVDGGALSADVVREQIGSTYFAKKHIGQPKYEDFTLEIGFTMAKAVYDWIAASWQMNYQRKNGSILSCDYDFNVKSERKFFDALLTETTFPACDAASKEAGYLTLKFAPEEIRYSKGSGKATGGTGKSQQKTWLPANFKLEIDGLECKSVSKVDSFTVKQTVLEDAIGEVRVPQKEPGKIEFPNLKITLSDATSQTWRDWFEDFVIEGNNADDKEKSGRLIFLSPDRLTELGSVKFFNLGIFRLSDDKAEANVEGIKRVTAELYCERMEFIYGPMPAATKPEPEPEPEPAPEPAPQPATPLIPVLEPVAPVPIWSRVPIPGSTQETTGRFLVLLDPEAGDEAVAALQDIAGLSVTTTAAAQFGVLSEEEMGEPDVVYDRLAVAVVSVDPEQLRSLAAAADERSPILAIEPERYVYALGGNGFENLSPVLAHSPEYVSGYRDAVLSLLGSTSPPAAPAWAGVADYEPPGGAGVATDLGRLTWGLEAIGAARGCFTGRGVRIAVLDTGLDLTHPDFAGRSIVAQSFVAGEAVQDGHGHGTHTIGTACGPRTPSSLPRYGIACDAEIYAGKVLSNLGRGTDQSILAGINWAVTNRCPIVSMSLGSPTMAGQRYSVVFENAARRAMEAGTLIVAAAGNDSRRDLGIVNPVSHPANCPSIMAVGALDAQFRVANFSNGGINPNGGEVDIAGPGVEVRSSWPMPAKYRTISGTSMATPHVAGALALFREANPQAAGADLWSLLARAARGLPLSASDVGPGLVQGP